MRSWWREKTKVVAHEGSEEVQHEPHDALRGANYSASGATMPVLAGRAAELVDSSRRSWRQIWPPGAHGPAAPDVDNGGTAGFCWF